MAWTLSRGRGAGSPTNGVPWILGLGLGLLWTAPTGGQLTLSTARGYSWSRCAVAREAAHLELGQRGAEVAQALLALREPSALALPEALLRLPGAVTRKSV